MADDSKQPDAAVAEQPLILVVDDEAMNVRLVSNWLEKNGYRAAGALGADEAHARIRAQRPDLILLDILMPETDGFQVLEHLRRDVSTQMIPVIMVSAMDRTEDIVRGLREGANDYATKPIDFGVLRARIDVHLQLSHRQRELMERTETLGRLASIDPLTGTYNRRALFDQLENELQRGRRYGRELSVVMLDLDHFKRVNDEHGHGVGDEVLVEFCRRASAQMRELDSLCRYGGEEFCAVLPETGTRGALAVAERVRGSIAGNPFRIRDITLYVTVSCGVATMTLGALAEVTRLLEMADAALYEAKSAGRNRVSVYDPARANPD